MATQRISHPGKSVYAVVTDRILDQLRQGVVPWHKPWAAGLPKNLNTGKPYRGVNVLVLGCAPYASTYWLTYKQAQARGGHVRKGEKSWPVVFWKWIDGKQVDETDSPALDPEPKPRKFPILRYYRVSNVEQCDSIEAPKVEARTHNPIEAAESIVDGFRNCPRIEHKNRTRAFYHPALDFVNIPVPELFDSGEAYYSVLFHELMHSTGHPSRLNRKGITDLQGFGSHEYSKEELVAELGAAMLCGVSGIENHTINNSAAYIQSWLRALQDDHKLVVLAAAQAQKAADCIQGHKFDSEEK